MAIKGNGGRYDYFGCQGRRKRDVTCYGPYIPINDVEQAIERHYSRHVGLTPAAQERIRAKVRRYTEQKLKAAKAEAERANRRLDTLKQEQQRLLQLSYQDLVDTDVLAAEQQRIKAERAQLAKWARAIAHDEHDIHVALDEALRLLDQPGLAYQQAPPTVRRMFNQALFDKLLILDDQVTIATPTPLMAALDSLGASQRRRPQTASQNLRSAIRAEQEAGQYRGLHPGGPGLHNARLVQARGSKSNQDLGSNNETLVRMRGLEPPPGCPDTDLNRARLPIPPHPRGTPKISQNQSAGRRPRVQEAGPWVPPAGKRSASFASLGGPDTRRYRPGD